MPVAIAGMHRSGTSMVARLLQQCGLDLGPTDQLLPPRPDNPEGFWEHAAFVALNDDILTAAGGSWNVPPPCPVGGTHEIWQPLCARAAALPAEIGLTEPWGWKDPRTSLTLPLWAAVWPDLRVVVCVRNPMEVAQSLLDRDDFTYRTGLRLWQAYHERLTEAIPAARRVVTHYDAYFIDAAAELRRVRDALGLPADDARLGAAVAMVAPRLRHARVSSEELGTLPLSAGVAELYGVLCAEAGPVAAKGLGAAGEPLAPRLFARTLRVEERLDRLAERVRELEQQLGERTAKVEHLEQYKAEMRHHLDMQHEQLTERCQRVQDLEARLMARRHRYADRVAESLKRARHPFSK